MRNFLFLTFLLLAVCDYNFEPSTTSVEYGTSENGKDKTSKSIKQTFKWNKNDR